MDCGWVRREDNAWDGFHDLQYLVSIQIPPLSLWGSDVINFPSISGTFSAITLTIVISALRQNSSGIVWAHQIFKRGQAMNSSSISGRFRLFFGESCFCCFGTAAFCCFVLPFGVFGEPHFPPLEENQILIKIDFWQKL